MRLNAALRFDAQNNQKAEFERMKATQLSKIMAHESAHASAAGSLGGPIQIEFAGNGMPVGGHVNIRMPGLDPTNPEQTLRDAQTVINAATAPGGDMSGQDASVAANAQAMFGRAQVLMDQKKLQQAQAPNACTSGGGASGATSAACGCGTC